MSPSVRCIVGLASLTASFVTASPFVPLEKRSALAISSITPAQWAALNQSVNGRLHGGQPLAEPCYSFYNGTATTPNRAQCSNIQANYETDTFVASNFGGYMNTNWGMCQATGQSCNLDYVLPSNPLVYAPPINCYQGSVSPYYIDVSGVSDIQAGLAFAAQHNIPLVVKNSGHDYKGRSSSPGSLALWTHNLQPALTLNKGFTPEGCSSSAGDGVTMGAGQGFLGLYEFAEANNITIVGGSSPTVGAAGGWIAGGGHSALSNTLGLGVDNALQMRGVLPNGTYITANRCQNQDIFYAWRGGGGSTFGVVTEMTTRANPQLTLQVIVVKYLSVDLNTIRAFIDVCTANANQWAADGWGGYIAPGAMTDLAAGLILVTPKLTYDEAVASMKPMTDYINSLGNIVTQNQITTETSFFQAYQSFIVPNEEKVGIGLALASRLIPSALLNTTAGQKSVGDALQQVANTIVFPNVDLLDPRSLLYGPPFQILVTAPSNYPDDGTSSVTPAWRSVIWHAVVSAGISNQASVTEINHAFQNAHDVGNILRTLAPNSGAYQNEAEVFEPDPAGSYWGEANYNRLMGIKAELDPGNVLTCWNCIGWDSSDPRYSCYPAAPSN